MKTVIYRISDLFHAGTIPVGGTFDSEWQLNVSPNFCGNKEDYAILDVPYDYFKLERIDGKVVAVEINPPPIPAPLPSESELLMDYVVNVDYRVTMIELGII